MTRREQKYVLDTQIFIRAFRDRAANEALQEFHRRFAPFEYMSAVVAQELRSGARTTRAGRALERHVLNVFSRTDRIVTPTMRAWLQSGEVLAKMAHAEGLEIPRVSKAFGNDVLLAISCREAGCVLVTDNERDFRRIQRYVQFEFLPPWSPSIMH